MKFHNIFFILLGDEMFSDTYKVKLVDDVIYEVYGRVCYISFFNILCSYINELFI